jgi:hypothetical protein
MKPVTYVGSAVLGLVMLMGLTGCGAEKVDGKLNIQLLPVCDPTFNDFQALIETYCISVEQVGGIIDSNCSSHIGSLELKVNQTSGKVRLLVEGLDIDGHPVVRGRSVPISLVSGEQNTISIPIAPMEGFGLLASQQDGCTALPYLAAGHSATTFPSGHVLVIGSGSSTVSPSQAAFLIDPVTARMDLIRTPTSLHRFGHSASLLGDGRLVVLGGQNQVGSGQDDIVVLYGTEKLFQIYDRANDYRSIKFESLMNRLMVARQFHNAAVFHGDQILVNDSERTAEMFIGSTEQSGFIQVTPPFDPFPDNNSRIVTVTPLDEERAIILGCLANHNGLLTVTGGSRNMSFTPYNLEVSQRSNALGIALPSGQAMFLGGKTGSAINDSPVVIIDPNTKTLHEVAIDTNTFPRGGYTATLLGDGRIFVVGGSSISAQYVPGSTFFLEQTSINPPNWMVYAGPQLMMPRSNHTASLLEDGRFLVIGGTAAGPGVTDQQVAASAEVIGL